MNSKISFYSFKDTDNNVTKVRFRKDKTSFFEEFQKNRLQASKEKYCQSKRKAISQSVLVRSEQQKQLLCFLQMPNLPSIKSKNKMRGCSIDNYNPQIPQKSKLDKILGNKKKFMRTYFDNLHNFGKNKVQQPIKHVFPETALGNWIIKGYLKGQTLILRGQNQYGHQRYLKYPYGKYIKQLKTNYQEFVQIKFQKLLLKENDL